VNKYLLAAKNPSGVVPGTGSLDVVSMNATAGNGGLVTFFTLRLPQNQQQLDSSTPIL
jgi:hypothetical protein